MTRLFILSAFVLMMSGCAFRHPGGTVYVDTYATSPAVVVHPHVRVHRYHKYGCYQCWHMRKHRHHYHPRGHRHPHRHPHYRR